MLSYDDMPEDNEDLAKIDIDFPHVSFVHIPEPKELEEELLGYLNIEGYSPESELKFLRTAQVEDTVYWIWELWSDRDKCFATVAKSKKDGMTFGCDTDYYRLTPEQYILGDYHECF